ncbi:MAG: amidase [Ancrocorticia sp.]|uniref:amidase n=1 Tax=Ancrocorticia sp. TaxID=2593684 RepID=UPI003F9251F9
MNRSFHDVGALNLRQMLAAGEVNPTEAVGDYLERIEALNPTIHALVAVDGDRAMERARGLERAAEHGGRPSVRESPLWGMPFADKDVTDRAGLPTTHGTVGLTTEVACESSSIARTMDAAGGISLGKTNVPEFAFSAYGENRLPGGPARNPWDLSRDTGGSSAGAAAAVAARMLPFAPGNDGGGSIRIPAAACGVVGLKPSRGVVPVDSLGGLVVGGPLARSIGDAALLFDGMAPGNSMLEAVDEPCPPLNLGWNMWSPWSKSLDIECSRDVGDVFDAVLSSLGRAGHSLTHVEPDLFPDFAKAFITVWQAGAAGLPIEDLSRFEALTQWLVRDGRKLSAADVEWALGAFAQFEAGIVADYAPYDAIVTPVLTGVAPTFGEFDAADGERNFAQQCVFAPYTSYLNVCGLPAISLPMGTNADGLPIGVQVIGRPGGEATLLQIGAQLEAEYGWDTRAPEL